MAQPIRHLMGVVGAEDLTRRHLPIPLAVGLRLDADGLPTLEPAMSSPRLAAYQCAAGSFIGVTTNTVGELVIVPDLLGLRPVYFCGDLVADRFLDLVDALLAAGRELEFEPESVVHFLEYRYPEPGHTLFKSIGRTRPGEAVVLRHGRFQRLELNTPSLTVAAPTADADDGKSSRKMIEAIGAHLQALLARIDRPTSLDLTGGVDSRLLATLAVDNPNVIDATCTHGNERSTEISLGRSAAEKLGLDYHFVASPRSMSWEDLLAAFDYVDGYGPLLNAHRLRPMQQARVRRGIEVAIHGEGGAAYKEFWWLQDFPFYKRRKPNIDRLIRVRINPIPLDERLLGETFRRAVPGMRQRYRSRLHELTSGLRNTEAYDQIYYFEKMASLGLPCSTGEAKIGIIAVAPLLNRADVGRAFRLARRHRIMNFTHRAIVARSHLRSIGKIKTTDGTSLRSGLLGILRDTGAWLGNKGVRLVKKLIQLPFGVTVFQNAPNRPEAEQDLMQLFIRRDMLMILKSHGIIRADVDEVDAFRGRRLQFWVCLALLASRLDAAASRPASEPERDALHEG